MQRSISAGLLLCLVSCAAQADVYLLDSDTAGPAAKARAAQAWKPGDKPGIPLSSVSPRPEATGSIALTDQSGLEYFINTNITFATTSSASGAASEASFANPVAASTSAGGSTMSTLNDAFDGYGALCVSLSGATGPCQTGNADYTIYNQNGAAPTLECGGRQVVYPSQTISGLSVSRKVYVPTDDSFARWMEVVSNPTGAPITANVILATNLGSDSNTTIVSTSSGDTTATTADQWVTTFQNFSGTTSSDPRLAHVLWGAGGAVGVSSINFSNGDDNPNWAYSLTVPAGGTQVLLHFVSGHGTRAAANANAARLATLPTTAASCMSPSELAQLVNFQGQLPDLSIVKTAPATVNTGAAFSYTLSVANGGSAATNVSVSDTLPAGVSFVSASGTGWACNQTGGVVTCTQPSLAGGPASPITIAVTAPATPGPVVNAATITNATGDSDPANNSSSVTTTVASPAAISATKTASGAFTVGSTVTYTITLSNTSASGQGDNPGDEFVDVLPAGLQLASATATSGSAVASVGTNTVTWNGAISGGGSVTITITAQILPSAVGTTVSNQGTVNYDADGNGSNESTTLTDDPAVGGAADPTSFSVGLVADVGITLTAPGGALTTFGNATFGGTISNAGPSAASNVSATVTFPAGYVVQSASAPGLTCTPAANAVTCTAASLAVGSSSLSINVVLSAAAGTFSANGSVSTTASDPNTANNTATVSFTVGSGQPIQQTPVPGLGLAGLLLLAVMIALLALRRRESAR